MMNERQQVTNLDYVEIGNRVRYFRCLNSLSQAELADRINISYTYMSNVECGKARVSLEVLVNIANELVISVDDLLGKNLKISEKESMTAFRKMMECMDARERELWLDVIGESHEYVIEQWKNQ